MQSRSTLKMACAVALVAALSVRRVASGVVPAAVPATPYNIPPYVHSYHLHATVPRVPAVYAAGPAALVARAAYPHPVGVAAHGPFLGAPYAAAALGARFAAPVAPVAPYGPLPVPAGPAPFIY